MYDGQEFQNLQKLLTKPGLLRLLLDQEIEGLDRLVERAMKKKPKSVKIEEEKEVVLSL